jgi:uncharacterized protein (DUF58 family)
MKSSSLRDLKLADQLSNKSTVVLISDFLVDPSKIAQIVSHFVNLGCRGFLMHIADPVEVDLPFGGRTRFLSMTEGEDITLGRVEVVRGEYQSLFNAHQQEILNIAKRVSWDYSFHRTDAPASEAFAALYSSLNIRGPKA